MYEGAAQVKMETPKPRMKRPAINCSLAMDDAITAEPLIDSQWIENQVLGDCIHMQMIILGETSG
jgi:hypothetical protein